MTGSRAVLVARLEAADRRRQALAQQLATVPAARPLAPVDWRSVEREARATMATWRELLHRSEASDVRPLLRALLEDRKIRFAPAEDGRSVAFEGDAGVSGLLSGVVTVGDHGKWRPHRDPGDFIYFEGPLRGVPRDLSHTATIAAGSFGGAGAGNCRSSRGSADQ